MISIEQKMPTAMLVLACRYPTTRLLAFSNARYLTTTSKRRSLADVEAEKGPVKSLHDFMGEEGGCGAGGSTNAEPQVVFSKVETLEPRPDLSSSPEARSWYRAILRSSRGIPTAHRRNHIKKRARLDFEENVYVTDPERIQ